MRSSSLTNVKLNNVDFSLMNTHLEEFDFSGNSQINNWNFLNKIF